ncbi:MAG: hypothetical protein CVT74_04095 [Alphaproteobacteria bacterium HGW-Alphaproteobacteria-13]|jgi:AcrR family transcriptional regulator|nr:MAG: hypothetical protein CVT74_04095 [Alphaproteobacteria bacterium HGW-Alphaproteobacteria-13]
MTNSASSDRDVSLFRRPRQARSRQRFEAILDSAALLLQTQEPDEISIYTLAETTGISPPSIYHFFPDASHVFQALAERFYDRFVEAFDRPPVGEILTWQDLQNARYEEGRDYYNDNMAARRLLLGSGMSAMIRARDLEIDRQLAERLAEELRQYFVIPDLPDLVQRLTEQLIISDALWTLSVHRHGLITDEIYEQSRRAREAFGRTFLPEYLPLREPQ